MGSGKFGAVAPPHEIGEIFPVAMHLGGVAPSNLGNAKYIELSTGKEGAGGYNFGLIDNVIVSGSSPLTVITAEIILSNSPLFGQLVHLLNSEGRFIFAGNGGTVGRHLTAAPVTAFSAVSNGAHTHSYSRAGTASKGFQAGSAYTALSTINTGSSGAHTHTISGGDVVTAPKRAEMAHFMRIL